MLNGVEATKPTHHPSYWFDDGSLVLHIQSTAYKLHRSFVTRHSPALQALTRSSEDGYSVSVLRIPDELGVLSADFERLLEHLYHDMYVHLITLSLLRHIPTEQVRVWSRLIEDPSMRIALFRDWDPSCELRRNSSWTFRTCMPWLARGSKPSTPGR